MSQEHIVTTEEIVWIPNTSSDKNCTGVFLVVQRTSTGIRFYDRFQIRTKLDGTEYWSELQRIREA